MDPPYHNPPPSPFLDLNVEDHHHDHPYHDDLFNLNHQITSSSNLFLSSPALMNIPPRDQGQFYYRSEPQSIKVHKVDDHKIVSSGGSSSCGNPRAAESESDHRQYNNDLKLSINWKSHEDSNMIDHDKSTTHVMSSTENNIDSSVKWMSSKMRMMRKMITNPDQTGGTDHHTPVNFTHKFDPVKKNRQHPTSPFGADHSSSSSSNNNTIRVCADCNTTKTPLWRSGPRGPKSLCNACGIRQRKARRAMAAAAAAANGTILPGDATSMKNTTKVQHKEKKSKNGNGVVPQFKKRCKLTSPSRGRKKLGFEDLAMSISKSSAAFQRVFPQDEKDAAILLMALSYGLVHG